MSGAPPSMPAATAGGLRALRKLRERSLEPAAGERCEMCASAIGDAHTHVVDVESRNLLCTCRACYLLFTQRGAAQGKFRAVPDCRWRLPDFRLDAAAWDAFEIPVRIAFFFENSALGRVAAFYPSPAGATESTLPLEAWQSLVAENPLLRDLEPDVEALLVYGPRDRTGFECFVVPIDACYELTGVVRQTWRGFDGGAEAHRAIAGFFANLHERSKPPPVPPSPRPAAAPPPTRGGA